VFLGVSLGGFFTVVSGMRCVPPRRVSMVRTLLMVSTLIVLGRLVVMASSMCVMFRGLLVVLGSFFRHGVSFILLFAVLRQVSKAIIRRTLCKIDHIPSVWFHGCISVVATLPVRR
jgi:hypothetical protein